jgi:hypothetical protein
MPRFLDRILEHSPLLAGALLGSPSDGDSPPPEPVVIVADNVLPGVADAPIAGTAASPPNCSPPWPLTFVEFGPGRGIRDVPGGLRVPTAMGWAVRKEGGVGIGPERLRATFVVEVDAADVRQVAELELDPDGQPRILSFAGESDGQSEVLRQLNVFILYLRVALDAASRLADEDAFLDLCMPSPKEDAGRTARGLRPLFPYFVLAADAG